MRLSYTFTSEDLSADLHLMLTIDYTPGDKGDRITPPCGPECELTAVECIQCDSARGERELKAMAAFYDTVYQFSEDERERVREAVEEHLQGLREDAAESRYEARQERMREERMAVK